MDQRLSSKDVEDLKRVTNECLSEIASGDFDDWVNHWTDDARLMPPNAADVVAHDALLQWISARPKVKRFDIFDMDIDGSGDVAIVISHFYRAFETDASDDTDQRSRQVLKFRPGAHGNWKICAAISNSSDPL